MLSRIVIYIFLFASVLTIQIGGAYATSFAPISVKRLVKYSDLIVKIKITSINQVFIHTPNGPRLCALEISGDVVDDLKGQERVSSSVRFISSSEGSLLGSKADFIDSPETPVQFRDWDLIPTEILVFLSSENPELDDQELDSLDSTTGTSRACSAFFYRYDGYITITRMPPTVFDRYAEKKFGGQWVRFDYTFSPELTDIEKIDYRVIPFARDLDSVYGVLNWEEVRAAIVKEIKAADDLESDTAGR